jgi:hypothetical protein
MVWRSAAMIDINTGAGSSECGIGHIGHDQRKMA